MSVFPRITVVTGSYNQGSFIGETIESVLSQNYPNLEHIVVDGMSTDETPAVLARYSHLRVVREPDKGLADAVNKGFRLATGAILCFLNSDDTLLPGALHRVAEDIDPARGRHVVMGRCRFIDENGHYSGIEHPCHFESFRRTLEVWKGHLIPQPSVFWTTEAWKACGPLDVGLVHLDYDFFCRLARRYTFHKVDQVLATYRLHTESKTMTWTEAERLEDAIRLSKRYWGSPLLPAYWSLAASLAWFRFDRVGRARRQYQRAIELQRHGHALRAAPHQALAGILAPDVAFYASVYPAAKRLLRGTLGAVLEQWAARGTAPRTAPYMDRTTLWEDGWAGPRLILSRKNAGGERSLILSGSVNVKYMGGPLTLNVRLNGDVVGQIRVAGEGAFSQAVPLPAPLPAGEHTVEILADRWVVYHAFLRNGDHRPLSWRPAGPDGVAFAAE